MSARARKIGLGFALSFAAFAVLSLLGSPEVDAQTNTNPCPRFSIQQVFADPSGDWDSDGVSNLDELYGGTKPCLADTGDQPLERPCSTGYWSWREVHKNPNGDWDHDGITNMVEARNGANPCGTPCPFPSNADLAIDPNGDWDRDGISNALEVNTGTNPCSSIQRVTYNYNPCPNWTQLDVNRMPNLDWDRDGRTNAYEASRGYNPCGITWIVVPPVVVVPQPIVIERPPPGYVCPAGFPYYYSATGLCHAQPLR